MKKLLLLFFCLLFRVSRAAEDDIKASKLADGLYSTLRSIAFPEVHQMAGVDGRFLLLMPGKVLNYFDYYPGTEYTNFIQVSSSDESIAK